jgi:hypothetical protein
LGVPDDLRLLTLIPIGVPTHWPEGEKKPLEEVLHWEKYGGKTHTSQITAAINSARTT